eukprot:TRINITY_DN74193_c0_g1_i1.p1 TRINITY_DN74193_c0_g1~~TRINITY_DN74193_c0_g1_i1.p1  ORF type:complete len:607 (-),score=147.78 TRINITY_DN74193_c0_g1_i1:67-1887(-)
MGLPLLAQSLQPLTGTAGGSGKARAGSVAAAAAAGRNGGRSGTTAISFITKGGPSATRTPAGSALAVARSRSVPSPSASRQVSLNVGGAKEFISALAMDVKGRGDLSSGSQVGQALSDVSTTGSASSLPSASSAMAAVMASPTASQKALIMRRVAVEVTYAAGIGDDIAGVTVQLTRGRQNDGSPLCDEGVVCASQAPAQAVFNDFGDGISGSFEVTGLREPIPFASSRAVSSSKKGCYIGYPDKTNCVLLGVSTLACRLDGSSDPNGIAVECSVGPQAIRIHIRPATNFEVERREQLQALKDAEALGEYRTLHAQVVKSRQRGVELFHIERAEKQIKELVKKGAHIDIGKDRLAELMTWEKVTSRPEGQAPQLEEKCTQSADCPCNQEFEGEEFSVEQGSLQRILGELAPKDVPADRWFFEILVEAALACPDGCCWFADGKYIMSAITKNQNLQATLMMLKTFHKPCAKALQTLAEATEKEYKCKVVATQVNFHPDGTTHHLQHRDIFSPPNKLSLNCTCSMRQCRCSICYTVGSTRQLLCEAMTDETSQMDTCSESCEGSRVRHWLDSGSVTFLNDVWNRSHTHGIPKCEHDCGPRISVAFLCA